MRWLFRAVGRATGIVLLAVLTLVACSSGGGRSGSGGGKADIEIGSIGTYSGPPAATAAGAQQTLQAWADSVNAAGGINGHKVHLTIKDDANNPTQALTAVKGMVEQDHVIAIVASESDADHAFATYLASKGIPVVGGISITNTFQTNPNFFPSSTTIGPQIYGSIALAKQQGAKHLGYLYCAESPLCAQTAPLYKALAGAAGMSFVYGTKISSSAADYTAPCLAAKNAGVDALSIGTAANVALRVATACDQQGLKPVEVATTNSVNSSWLTVPAVDGVVSAAGQFPWFDTSTATKQYRDALAKYAPELAANSGGGTGASNAWVAGKLFEAAVKASGTKDVTSSSVLDGLYKLHNETLGGLAPPLSYAKGKAHAVTCYFSVGVKGGKFTEPNGLKTQCASSAALKILGVG